MKVYILYNKVDNKILGVYKIEKEAKGKSFIEAKERASSIEYNYKVLGNKIIFNSYFLTNIKNQNRGQEIKIYLYFLYFLNLSRL
mgnify:CR=1 FL=1